MRALYDRYERFLMPLMLVAGLVVDFVTFKSIQITTALSLLGIYFVIAGLAIAYIHVHDIPRPTDRHAVFRLARLGAQLAVQFAFGALLSASFIFYWFSGSVSVSWPFILLIALLMVSNDVFRHYYAKPVVQVGVYFFVSFSLFSLVLPVIFNSIEVWLFVYAGVLSLLFITMYILILSRLVESVRQQRYSLFLPVVFIYFLFNGLYFYNVIPPIPLSLREAGVYHNVQRAGGDYVLQGEPESWLARVIPGQTIHLGPNERAYVFASVFAPADLNIKIFHDWQYYDEANKRWVSSDRISYAIAGGRKDGYRGYSTKSVLLPGKWRVDVQTERGQVLGRVRFDVEKLDKKPELVELIR